MEKYYKIYQNLAESLSQLFSPMAEVALYDKNEAMLCVYNRLTHDPINQTAPNQQIKMMINKNQPAKLMIIPLEQGYYLRIIVDISAFESLATLLQHYLLKENKNEDVVEWQQLVDAIIENYVKQHNTVLAALSPQDKRALVLVLHQKNIFRYQDATNYLAAKLQVSRATIYNYLKQASQLKSLQIHQVDAFTDEPFCGNPAGVVLDADKLNETMMKKIAREMNLSETSFVLKSKKANIKLRYFTPSGCEVKFCGHSTVGALYMLAHSHLLGIDKPGLYDLLIETNAGIIPASIKVKTDLTVTIQFQTPKVELVASKIKHKEISSVLGIPFEFIDVTRPVMYEKTNQDLYLTISSLKHLGELHVDQKSAKHFAEEHNIVAYALLCNETIVENNHIHMRCFAPAVGIAEDPFTGSVLGGLAAYVTKNKLIQSNLKTIRVEQGHFMSRPGYVELKLNESADGGAPLVIAKARHFFSTEIEL